MYYSGIDYHKKYSTICIMNEKGEVVLEKRVDHRNPKEFERIHASLPVQSVLPLGTPAPGNTPQVSRRIDMCSLLGVLGL